jgi:hypothetical protein
MIEPEAGPTSPEAAEAAPVTAMAAPPALTPAPLEGDALRAPIGWREVLGRALDLSAAANLDIRKISILVGLLVLAAAGPYVAMLLAVVSRLGGFAVVLGEALPPPSFQPISRGTVGLIDLATLIGAICVIALIVDSQLLGVVVVATRATGRRFVLRKALELSRMRFWRLLRANAIIFVILFVPRQIIERTIAPAGIETEAQFVTVTIVGVILSIPFAYVSALIMLASAGARESVRRSWRLARARPSIALVIAVINVLFQTIALFALGAAFELMARLADVLHLGEATGIALFAPLSVILALAITAAGSLIPTIAALSAAPPVVAFLSMTGTVHGLDILDDPDNPFATPRTEPLVSRPMKIALAIEFVIAALAVSQIL